MTRSLIPTLLLGLVLGLEGCQAGAGQQSPPPRPAASSGPKVFGGKVLEANPSGGWFIMQGGASKRYARVKVLYDKQTHWSGMARADHKVRAGDAVRVNAVPDRDSAFRATSLELQQPNEHPSAAGIRGAR